MRFILTVFAVLVLGLAGLFVYGHMLEPDIRTIELDVSGAADAS